MDSLVKVYKIILTAIILNVVRSRYAAICQLTWRRLWLDMYIQNIHFQLFTIIAVDFVSHSKHLGDPYS